MPSSIRFSPPSPLALGWALARMLGPESAFALVSAFALC